MKKNEYYRPEWTCGRYNEEHKVALFYNLISGYSYFFEDASAMVIGKVLASPRNGCFCLGELSEQLNIALTSLQPFLQTLEEVGLVSSVPITADIIADYRRRVSAYNISKRHKTELTTQEKLPYEVSNAERLYTEKVGGITNAMFELTYQCSEQCIHCYNIGATRNDSEINGRGQREELSLDEYKNLIDCLYAQGLVKVCLSGGDPFSKPIVWDIIDYLYRKEIAFDVFTNGQRIVEQVQRLADYYPRMVGVSIYSGLPEVHDAITRRPRSWQRSVEVIAKLSALGVPQQLKCCVMRPNVKSYYLVADMARQYGAVPLFEVSLTDSIEGDKCVSKYLRLLPEHLEIVLRDDNVPLYVGKEAPGYGAMERDMESNPCGAGENSICVTPEGNIIPCCAFHTLFGNLREQSLAECLKSRERQYWLSLSLNRDYEECGKHTYCTYCNLCPGNNYVEHGTPLKASEVNCFMAKIRYDLAQKLKDGIDPLQGKSLRERLAELPDYQPEKIQREMSADYSDKRLMVGG